MAQSIQLFWSYICFLVLGHSVLKIVERKRWALWAELQQYRAKGNGVERELDSAICRSLWRVSRPHHVVS